MSNWKTVFKVLFLLLAMLRPVCNAQSSSSTSSPSDAEKLSGLNTAFIDKSADPCADFFQYACGKFSALHPIPPDRSSFGSMSMLADENEKILHAILGSGGGRGREPNPKRAEDWRLLCLLHGYGRHQHGGHEALATGT